MASETSVTAGPTDPVTPPASRLGLVWRSVTTAILAGFFLEAVFAGAMLSGVPWALKAHAIVAAALIIGTVVAGLVSFLALGRVAHGSRLGVILLALAATTLLQAMAGALSVKGANLLWVHVPLGVALVGLASQAIVAARPLGRD